jgi:hypothetical protein
MRSSPAAAIRATPRGRRASTAILGAILAASLASGCDPARSVEARTFDLAYLDSEEAGRIIGPYVNPPGMIETFPSGITVRERPEVLHRIAEVLAEYDVAKPGVRLYFQLIEADGFTGEDERIADVEQVLRDLFRFEGYRLVDEARLALVERARSSQEIAGPNATYDLVTFLSDVRTDGDGGDVTMMVSLSEGVMGDAIATTLTVPVGETVVLGSSRGAGGPTLILTVRPELIER